MTIYIKDKKGKTVATTRRIRLVRKLLEHKKATVIRNNPFTVKLLCEIDEDFSDFLNSLKKRAD